MPAVASRGSRRRTINEINMVPFIDVMLVLLIIFMVTAPLITTGVVDVPTMGATTKSQPPKVIELVVGADEQMRLRSGGQEIGRTTLADLGGRIRQAQAGDPAAPVVISADRNVKYESVVKAMDALKRAGVERVGLSVKQAPGS